MPIAIDRKVIKPRTIYAMRAIRSTENRRILNVHALKGLRTVMVLVLQLTGISNTSSNVVSVRSVIAQNDWFRTTITRLSSCVLCCVTAAMPLLVTMNCMTSNCLHNM